MSKKLKMQSTSLSLDEWANLQRLACEMNSIALYGSNAGQPSWRTLIKEIARDEIVLSRPVEQLRTYTLKQAAVYLDISEGGLRYYIRGKELFPDRRNGKAFLFYQKTLDYFQAYTRRTRKRN